MAGLKVTEIKHYKFLNLIGKGGMAEVYRAEDTLSGQIVAIKILPQQVSSEKNYVERFKHEIRATSTLRHNNIVQVMDGGEHEGMYFMVMEFIDGMTLEQFLDSTGPLYYPVALYIIREVLKGLEYSHHSNIIHRDIKPANIMISRTGEVKIADFGILKAADYTMLTQDGNLMGTPAYMSPEQVSGKQVSARSDLFSVGVVLYEMISAISPFDEGDIAPTIMKVLRHNPLPLFFLDHRIPMVVQEVVDTMCAKAPEHRYPDCHQAVQAVNAVFEEIQYFITKQKFRDFQQNPARIVEEIDRELAVNYSDRARNFVINDREHRTFAFLDLYRAYLHDPANHVAVETLTAFCQKRGISVLPIESPLLNQYEEELRKDPSDYDTFVKRAEENLRLLNIFSAVFDYLSILRLRPNNTAIRGKVSHLLARFEGADMDALETAWRGESLGLESKAPSSGGAGAVVPEGFSQISQRRVSTEAPKEKIKFTEKARQTLLWLRWASVYAVGLGVVWFFLMGFPALDSIFCGIQSEDNPLYDAPQSPISTSALFVDHPREDFGDLKRIYERALERRQRGDLRGALDSYQDCLYSDFIAMLHFEMGTMEKELAFRDPAHKEALFNTALKRFQFIIDEFPKSTYVVDARWGRARILSERSLLSKPAFDQTMDEYLAMQAAANRIKDWPSRFLDYFRSAALFLANRGDSPRAVEYYNLAIAHARGPATYRKFRIEKADLLAKAGRKLDAYRLYEELYFEATLESEGVEWVKEQIKNLGAELNLPRFPTRH